MPSAPIPQKAPAFHWYDAPGWAAVGGCMPVEANYFLLVDNLLDLSHLAFLHIKSIGAAEDTEPELTWERGDDFVRGVRIARNLSPSARNIASGEDMNVDTTKVMTYTPPGNVVIEITTLEAGKGADNPTSRVNRQLIVLDSMTPETETSCHYFWGSCRDNRIDDEAFSEQARQSTIVAFTEDTEMLEAEQKIIDFNPDASQVNVTGDQGGLYARRLMDGLLAKEYGVERAAAE